jgi:sigma-B regulation protein RsbU (phosphoserine phosphatase)
MHDPAELMQTINQELFETAVHGKFVTMVAGLFDPLSREIRLVNAGHLPVLLVRADGKCKAIPSNSPPLGITADAEFREIRIPLKGLALYLYTDGLSEYSGKGNDAMTSQAMCRLFLTHHKLRPARRRLHALVHQLGADNGPLDDDLTILTVE